MGNLPVLLFDDSCGVCHWLVRFVLRHDRQGRFRFAGLESEAGRALRRSTGGNPTADSVVLIAGSRAYLRSDAVIEVGRQLGWPWRLVAALELVPRRWRDAGYDAMAARRDRISRRLGLACTLPTIEERDRFLDRGSWPNENAVT